MSERKIALIIDDSEAVRSKLSHWFSQKGFHVLVAVDGEDGYNKIKENEGLIILIATDFNMPKMNGGELLYRLEEEKIAIDSYKIFLTTETPKVETFNFNNITNFKSWILKPINEKKFSLIMEKLGIF